MDDGVVVRIEAVQNPSFAQVSAWSRLWARLLAGNQALSQGAEVTSPPPGEAVATEGESHEKEI